MAQPSVICNFDDVQLQVTLRRNVNICRPIESFCPTSARKHTLRNDPQHLLQNTLWHASVPKPDLNTTRPKGVRASMLSCFGQRPIRGTRYQ